MPTTVEYGYLGSISMESGAGISRLPTLSADGNAIYNPASETGWANELIAPDGAMRFMTTGTAVAANGNVHNFADEVTVVMLLRMRQQPDDWGSFVVKKDTIGWNFSEISSTQSYYVRVDTSAGTNQACGYSLPSMRKTFDRNWHWVAFSLNRGNYKSWLNGLLIHQATYNHGAGLACSAPFNVQCNGSSQSQIACALVYGRELSDAEIASLVKGTVAPRSINNLSGYYKFNERNGTVCTDYSGNGNHMTYSQDANKLLEEWWPNGEMVRDSNATAPLNSVWDSSATITTGAGKIAFAGTPVNLAIGQAVHGVAFGKRYKVSFSIRNYVSGNVRVLLYGNGVNGATGPKNANGDYSEVVTINALGGSFRNALRVQCQVEGTTLDVTNVSVIPLDATDGLSGQPYPIRRKRDPSNWWNRSPQRVPSPAANGCIMTNASGAFLTSKPAFALNGDFTVCFKAKFRKSEGITLLYGYGSAYSCTSFRINTGFIPAVTWGDGTSSATTLMPALAKPIPVNTWVDIQFVRQDNNLSMYINNVLASQVIGFTQPYTGASNGNYFPTASGGLQRSTRIFNRALSAQERESIFLSDTCQSRDGIVAEWLCNDMTTPLPQDTSGNGYHTTSGGQPRILDSPHAMLRRKRMGKQLYLNNSKQVSHSSPEFRAKLVGSRYLTISCWVKTIGKFDSATPRFGINTSTLVAGFIGGGNTPDGSLICYMRSVENEAGGAKSSAIVQYAFPRQKWTLASLEIDYTLAVSKIWIDGVVVSVSQLAAFTSPVFNDSGNSQAIVSSTTDGIVFDDFRIYNRQLSSAEHYAIFMNKAPSDGLVLEYTFDNDTGGISVDSSGNGFNGTWIGGLTASNFVSQQ